MAETEHTKTPWYVDEIRGAGLQIIIAPTGFEVCKSLNKGPQTLARANAAYIVKAVNSHAAMVEALREASYFILAPAEDIKDGVLSRIRAALTLSQGEQP